MSRQFVGRLLAGLLVALGLVLIPAAPASAHATLVSSNPSAGAVVDSAPGEVTLTFSETVNVALGRVVVVDPNGKEAEAGKASRDGDKVTSKLKKDLPRGTYVVSYRVVSADGHPISGAVSFSIGAPSKNSGELSGSGEASVDPAVRGILYAAKFAGYAGLALLAGSLLILLELWPRRIPLAGPRRLAWIGWGALFGGTAVSLVTQVPYVTGGSFASFTWSDFTDTSTSGVGAAQVVRLAVLLAAIPAVLRITGGRAGTGRADRLVTGALFAALLLTWPFAGHASASAARLISIPADAVHVGAMAIWIGGLVVLAAYLLPRARIAEGVLILPVWSRWATYAVVALAFTGTVQALLEVGTFSALVGTAYGQLVIAKIVVFAVILGVAAFARSWVQRIGSGDRDPAKPLTGIPGARAFRIRLGAEVGLATVTIMLATVLVQTSPGTNAGANPAGGSVDQPGIPRVYTMRNSTVTLQADVDPGTAGNNTIHLYAFTPDGSPLTVVEWKVTASLKDKKVEPLDVPILPITTNHATGDTQLPLAGNWTFTFTIRVSDIDQSTVSQIIPIR